MPRGNLRQWRKQFATWSVRSANESERRRFANVRLILEFEISTDCTSNDGSCVKVLKTRWTSNYYKPSRKSIWTRRWKFIIHPKASYPLHRRQRCTHRLPLAICDPRVPMRIWLNSLAQGLFSFPPHFDRFESFSFSSCRASEQIVPDLMFYHDRGAEQYVDDAKMHHFLDSNLYRAKPRVSNRDGWGRSMVYSSTFDQSSTSI